MSSRKLVINGVTFIRSRDAARIVNLAADYISRLARQGMIQGRLVAKAQLTAAEYNRHKVLSNWTQIRSTLADLVPRQRVAAQVALVEERYFAPHIQMRQFLLSSRPPPDRRPMSATEWFRQAALGIDAMIGFSRVAG